jgi:hypothetical protein
VDELLVELDTVTPPPLPEDETSRMMSAFSGELTSWNRPQPSMEVEITL